MDVQGCFTLPRPRGDRAHRNGVDSPDTVDGGADPHPVPAAQLLDARRPALDITVRERALDALERPSVDATAQVARIEQRDAYPFRCRGLDQRLAQVVAITVQVVKLADSGDARVEHLSEDSARVIEVARPVPALRRVEHLTPPFPEVGATRLCASAQRLLERMAVHVCKAGECESLEASGAGRGSRVLGDGLDAPVFDLDENVGRDVAEPCVVRVPEPGASHVLAPTSPWVCARPARARPRARARIRRPRGA